MTYYPPYAVHIEQWDSTSLNKEDAKLVIEKLVHNNKMFRGKMTYLVTNLSIVTKDLSSTVIIIDGLQRQVNKLQQEIYNLRGELQLQKESIKESSLDVLDIKDKLKMQ